MAKKTKYKNSIDRLLQTLRLRKGKSNLEPVVIPAKSPNLGADLEGKQGTYQAELAKAWDWWLKTTNYSYASFNDRMKRYSHFDLMYMTSAEINFAADLYADEIAQVDSQTAPINIDATSNVKKRCNELLAEWGIDQNWIRKSAYEVCGYGEKFFIPAIDGDKGVTALVEFDKRQVEEKLLFQFGNVLAKMNIATSNGAGTIGNYLQTLQNDLVGDAENVKDVSNYYVPLTLGWKLTNSTHPLPPWGVLHMKRDSSNEQIQPWGESLFLKSASLYERNQALQHFASILRQMGFPREIISVEMGEEMSPSDIQNELQNFAEQYQNVGQNGESDDPSMNSRVFIAKNLMDYRLESPNIDFDRIADVELSRDQLIESTRVPKGYRSTERTFGVSGQSLLQQFKPFARAAYTIQTPILKTLTEALKLHFAITGEFDGENTVFVLSMNFPAIEEVRDRTSAKSDSLRLANDVISGIQSALGTRDGVPPEVAADILGQLSFVDPDDIKKWLTKTAGGPEEADDIRDFYAEHKKILTEKVKDRILTAALRKANITEGSRNGRHIYSSTVKTPDVKLYAEYFRKYKTEDGKKPIQENLFKNKEQ